MIDSHCRVIDPARFPYRADTAYRPAGLEVAPLHVGIRLAFLRAGERIGYGPIIQLAETLLPKDAQRACWNTPRALFGFGR